MHRGGWRRNSWSVPHETGAIISAQPTAEFDPLWGRGYVAGMHFTRMVLAGMGRN